MCESLWTTGELKWHGTDGLLCVLEKFPFIPKRMFYVTNVPKGEVRGCHAHYETEQILICIQGLIQVSLYDGYDKLTWLLKPNQYIYVPKRVWDSQIYMTHNDILLALCSTEYDPKDYIHDKSKFEELAWTEWSNSK